MRLTSKNRIAILMHEGTHSPTGKTGLAMLRYSTIPTVAVIDYAHAGKELKQISGIDRKVPIVDTVKAALVYKPDILAIGIAPSGGSLPEPWYQEVKQALAAGLNIVNGLHTLMAGESDLASLLQENQWIWDVRKEPDGLSVGTGKARHLSCKRVLGVGTDMSIGKMSANLELHRACQSKGIRSKVIATGQTNLMLGDDGIPLDAIRVDFAAGAVESMVMKYGNTYDILFIEGQGSLLHPSSTATLPLLRGAQPTHLILCHRAGQRHVRHFPEVIIPPLPEVISLYENIASACGAFYPAKVSAIALNTAHLNHEEAKQAIEAIELETGLPCTDTIRYGADTLLSALL